MVPIASGISSFSDVVVQEYGGGRPLSRCTLPKSQLLAIRTYSGYFIVSTQKPLASQHRLHRQTLLGEFPQEKVETPAEQVGRFPLAGGDAGTRVVGAIRLRALKSIQTVHGGGLKTSLRDHGVGGWYTGLNEARAVLYAFTEGSRGTCAPFRKPSSGALRGGFVALPWLSDVLPALAYKPLSIAISL